MNLSEISKNLNFYSTRDKTLRLLGYGSLLLSSSPLLSANQRQGLRIISAKFSETRTVLRLMDDIPMLRYTLQYGLGSKKVAKV